MNCVFVCIYRIMELLCTDVTICLMFLSVRLAFDPHFKINNAVSNIICSIVFGHRFDYQDEKLLQFLHILNENLVLEGGFWGQMLNTFPFLINLPGPQRKIFENHEKGIAFLQEIVTAHKESWDPSTPRDFIDAFLAEQEKRKDNPGTSFQASILIGTVYNLFGGGTETTSTTLRWGLLFMMLHPDIQSRVHEEIDRVIGKDRRPRLEDREEMPFTNAVIHETQRLGNIVPISLPHETYRDTMVMGYTIPKLRKKYGDVVSLEFGWTNLVVLSGFKTLKEALVKKSEDFADRPTLPIYEKVLNQSGEGIVFAKYGNWWREQRRFSISTLRNFGLGKKSLELQIVEEAEFLSNAFEEEKGLVFDPHFKINNAVSNIICSIVFGHRFDYQDEKFLQFLHILNENLILEGGFWGQMLNTFPFLINLPGPQRKIFENQEKGIAFLQEIVTAHKESWDPSTPRDFIDAFLAEQEKRQDNPGTSFQASNLIGTVFDLFAAGTETTSTTLRWGLLFMMLHPDIQSRVHEEIDRMIGKDRRPRLEDREEMPFTNAVIHETQRLGNIVPISLPHETYRDTMVMGYTIPKGTMIIPNLTSALFDEDLWSTPYQFNPGHFLNTEGKFVKPEAFIPFSAGHRVCLGEQLAKTELFIFFTSMLQRFTFFLPENEPKPNYRDAQFGITLSPAPYRLCVKVR